MDDDLTLAVFGRRKRGRPRALDPTIPLTVWIPLSEHDRIVRLADRRGASVSSTVRILLQKSTVPPKIV
jgi:hypothetical protein